MCKGVKENNLSKLDVNQMGEYQITLSEGGVSGGRDVT